MLSVHSLPTLAAKGDESMMFDSKFDAAAGKGQDVDDP